MRDAPRELGVTLVKPPPLGPEAPPMVEMLWAGDEQDAARAVFAPVLAAEGVGPADLQSVPYASTLTEQPSPPPGPSPQMASSNGVFGELSDATVDRAAAALAAHPTSMFEIRFLGGALGDVLRDATAPTARPSSPSRMSAAISSIATLTCSGTATSPARALVPNPNV